MRCFAMIKIISILVRSTRRWRRKKYKSSSHSVVENNQLFGNCGEWIFGEGEILHSSRSRSPRLRTSSSSAQVVQLFETQSCAWDAMHFFRKCCCKSSSGAIWKSETKLECLAAHITMDSPERAVSNSCLAAHGMVEFILCSCCCCSGLTPSNSFLAFPNRVRLGMISLQDKDFNADCLSNSCQTDFSFARSFCNDAFHPFDDGCKEFRRAVRASNPINGLLSCGWLTLCNNHSTTEENSRQCRWRRSRQWRVLSQ